jgi:PPM family protein phosphatase
VADGLGGHAAGEVASALAVETLVGYFTSERPSTEDSTAADIERLMIEGFETADARVREAAQRGKGREGMGTTLIAAYIRGDHLHTCHVGDVRCYVWNAEGLRAITQDHSLVGYWFEQGN